jgi:hypothetical protein
MKNITADKICRFVEILTVAAISAAIGYMYSGVSVLQVLLLSVVAASGVILLLGIVVSFLLFDGKEFNEPNRNDTTAPPPSTKEKSRLP